MTIMKTIRKYMNTLRVASVVIMTGAALFSLSSCYDDDSSEGKGVNNIAISGINLDGYTEIGRAHV